MTPAQIARILREMAVASATHPQHIECLNQAAAYLIEFETLITQLDQIKHLADKAQQLELEVMWLKSGGRK